MSFNMKYSITKRYLTGPSKRRPMKKIDKVLFVVAHDTGNEGSTASGNVAYYERSRNEISASAHIFVDDKEIIECIPALTGTPEKAWHVIYNVTKDNEMYGDDANDAAIGVEYCYGKNINADEAYKRYVWVLAYTCYKFGLDPRKAIVGHHVLDPQRKTDPKSGLAKSGRTYEQLLKDVVDEYVACGGKLDSVQQSNFTLTKYGLVKYGDRGEAVKTVQKLLNAHGFNLTVDGIFGKQTEAAVIQFQKSKGLVPDGIVGEKTKAALLAVTQTITQTQMSPQYTQEKEVNTVKLNDWEKEVGEEAVDFLAKEGIIKDPAQWKRRLGESTPNWLLFELLRRVIQSRR